MIEVDVNGVAHEFPDSMSESEIKSVLAKKYGQPQVTNTAPSEKAKERSFFALPEAITNPSPETIAADPLVRFAVGAGKGAVGTAQLLMKLGGLDRKTTLADRMMGNEPSKYSIYDLTIGPLVDRINRTEDIQKQARGGDFNAMGLVGEVLNPVGLKASKLAAPAETALKRAGQGAVLGGANAATVPISNENENFIGTKAAQVGTGAALGGILSGSVDATKFVGKSAISFIRSLVGNNADELATKYTNEIVGPQNIKKIVKDVQDYISTQGPPVTPGYKPTVAEIVSGRPEASPLIALQKQTAKTQGGPSALFGERVTQQNSALNDTLSRVAGTPEKLKAAEALREGTSAVTYPNAFAASQKIPADRALLDILKNPFVQKASAETADLASARGVDPNKNWVEYLHLLKTGLDDQLSKTGNETLPRLKKKAVMDAKESLVNWLDAASPLYAKARSTFKEQSVPINQMQVGQALQQKLFGPTESTNPGAFFKMIADEQKAVKSITGQPRSDFGQVLSAPQTAAVNDVGRLLERRLAVEKPAQSTSLLTSNIANQEVKGLPSLFSRPVVIANWVLKTIKGSSGSLEQKIDSINAARMLDPAKFAEAMKEIEPSTRELVMRQLIERHGVAPFRQGLLYPTTIGASNLVEEQSK